MGVFDSSAAVIAVACVPAYLALQIMLLVRSIQAIVSKDGLCTDGSFRWIWFICVSSALFAYGLIQNRDRKTMDLATAMATVVIMFVSSLGFALGTQFQYLDGCPAGHYAHLTMTIYMWGNYAVCMATMLVAGLLGLHALCGTRNKPYADEAPV